tara:strand:+ start:144 stop:809 length:666 start_codon:yes stop_codon:yes gene_type:complete
MDKKKFNWSDFEQAVSFLKTEVDELKWRDVIKASTGKEVLSFNKETLKAIEKLDTWISQNFKKLQEIGESYSGRVNEFGNFLEKKVEEMFQHDELEFTPTKNVLGRNQTVGYPDYNLTFKRNTIYGDCKVVSTDTINSSQRSFYYQPTKTGKILKDAPHFLLVFIREQKKGDRNKNDNSPPFKIIDYKIVDLYDFTIGFKAEFQANNIETFNLKELSKKSR